MGDTPEWITRCQNELGAVISHPKLSEKLLQKPPVRFLHDIVTSFIKTTNFPDNYYEPDMLDSAKLVEKEAKLEFLTKLVTVVQIATGKTTSCKPAKTLAGQEPEGTCDLLCLLASCAALSPADKQKAVKKALGEAEPEPAPKKDDSAEKEKEREREREREKEEKERERRERKERERAEKEKEREREKEKEKEQEKTTTPPPEMDEEEGRDDRKDKKDKRDKRDKKDKKEGGVAEVPKLGGGTISERPSTATARKPPPPVRSNEVQEERVENPKEVAAVIREEKRGKGKEDEKEEQDWEKLVEEHAAARANTHAKADEAAGYLGQAAIEARRRQEALKKAEDAANESSGAGLVLKTSKNKDKSGSAVGDSELSRLREQLQMLTKATNPLGKFLEAIHEDIDTMSRELEMWRTEARTQATAALEAQRQTEESLHGVQAKIQNVEDSISDQLNRTNILRATILNNDRTIETLIKMVVNPDTGLSTKKKPQ